MGIDPWLAAVLPQDSIELTALVTTLTKRALDILAYFGHVGSSIEPNEVIIGRLENLGGSALGFRILANFIVRSLLKPGGLDRYCTTNFEELSKLPIFG
ncbi:hypothetical protein ACIOTN_07045 [Glutamicibacter sp. NPDC087661]|uniref:hypothetical protein n=1 Tax=Glutamicibacter sp. NPDC087661 TaxID=3363996 RepID=UPI00380B5A8A